MHSTYVGQRQRTYSESLYAIPDMTHMRQLIRGGVVAGTGGALRERPRADGQRQRHQHLPVRERLAGAHCVYSGVQVYTSVSYRGTCVAGRTAATVSRAGAHGPAPPRSTHPPVYHSCILTLYR
jgi:hypothetical protein